MSTRGIFSGSKKKDWIYRIEFDLQISDYEHLELVAEGLDTVTEIRLNNGLGPLEPITCLPGTDMIFRPG